MSPPEPQEGRCDCSPGQRPPRPPPGVKRHLHQPVFFPIWFGAPEARQTRLEKRQGIILCLLPRAALVPSLAQGYFHIVPDTGLQSGSLRSCFRRTTSAAAPGQRHTASRLAGPRSQPRFVSAIHLSKSLIRSSTWPTPSNEIPIWASV